MGNFLAWTSKTNRKPSFHILNNEGLIQEYSNLFATFLTEGNK